MMTTTGLLSLSVHEALTFEGTEIALNPDILGDLQGNARQSKLGNISSSVSVKSSGVTHTIRSTSNDSSDHPEDDGIFVSSPMSRSTSRRKLEVGDMIEIQVWDPISVKEKPARPPQPQRNSSPSASLQYSVDSSQHGSGGKSERESNGSDHKEAAVPTVSSAHHMRNVRVFRTSRSVALVKVMLTRFNRYLI